jgi:hypothetical protein
LIACWWPIVDRLVYGSTHTFDPADALLLARIMPRKGFLTGLGFGIEAKGSMPGGTSQGAAAGVGNVSMRDGDRSFELDSAAGRMVRAGQWKLVRSARSILIEQVMGDFSEGRTARIDYRGGQPIRMCLVVDVSLAFGPITLNLGRFRPWKTPYSAKDAAHVLAQ